MIIAINILIVISMVGKVYQCSLSIGNTMHNTAIAAIFVVVIIIRFRVLY